MAEREPQTSLPNGVRELSREILLQYPNILSINNNVLESSFVPKVSGYAQKSFNNASFQEEDMSQARELGLALFLDVVNFCFQNPYTKEKYTYTSPDGKKISGSSGLKAAMKNSDIDWANINNVSGISNSKWLEMIQFDHNRGLYIAANRGRRIVGFANFLHNEGINDLQYLLDRNVYDTGKILDFLDFSGYFTDPFHKRSQLAVNMIDQILKRTSDKSICSTETLTVMADYRLPQLMYNLGAIELSPKLEYLLRSQITIYPNTPEEKSLRAASIIIGEKTARALGVTEGQVDSYLWSMARETPQEIPHMLVPTDCY